MVGKYLFRGIGLALSGIALNLFSYYRLEETRPEHDWAMFIGTIAFGIGFVLIVYGLIRKIDRKSILEERAEAEEKT